MAGAKRTGALLAIAAAAILLAAGCGGGGGGGTPLSKQDYVKRMTTIGRSLSTSLSSVQSAKTATKAATALSSVQSDLRTAADRLDSINPPEAIKSQHASLVKAVRDFADELDPVIAKLKNGDLTALASVPTLKGVTEIQDASSAITSKGYNIAG
jgi:hypothetical protein